MFEAACISLSSFGMSIKEQLKKRTFDFSVAVFKLSRRLARDSEGRIVRNQLIRASSGTAANYRAACRGRSPLEFIAKIGTTIEEADESLFWLEFIEATELILANSELKRLRTEADELVAIFTKSHKTAKANLERARQQKRKQARR